MTETVSLLCPTRERPHGMQRLWASVAETAAALESVELIYYVDDDDQISLDRFEQMQAQHPDNLTLVKGPRIVLSEMWNRCYDACKGTIIGCCGDDLAFRTQNWDAMVRAEFAKIKDRILMVYGRDGIQDHTLATVRP